MIVSLSKKAFTTKPIVPTFNSKTFRVNVELSAEELCHELTSGHILVPKIQDITERNGKIDRTVKNIEGRQYVMVDIESDDYDKIPEITPQLFLKNPSDLAPTFVYASYSDGVKGHRFHFVWVFNQLIKDKETNIDLWNRCRTIARDIVGERFEDDESVKDMARLCFGSYNKPWFSTNGFKTYNISDFDSVIPFSQNDKKYKAKLPDARGTKRSASKPVSGDIYDKVDHFGYERRQDVIFTLFHFWQDPDKVRELYAEADPNRTNPLEGESLINSAIEYHQQGRLYPTSDGIAICRKLNILPQRNDFTQPLVLDTTIQVKKYISDKYDEVLSHLGKMSLIISEPGSGKTHFSQQLRGNVLVVQMLKSIVDSSKFPDNWVKVYDMYHFPKFENQTDQPTQILCTIDKLAQLSTEQLKHFDYIVVDESHIIFESSEYRRLSFAISLFSDLCDTDWAGKVVLMTGTPILEQKYFRDLHVIKIVTDQRFTRKCSFHVGKNPEQRIVEFIGNSLQKGRKILFPTNRSKARSRIISEVRKKFPQITVNCQVFSRPLHEEEGNVRLRNQSTIQSDTNVLCCTTYLSVGLDIFDPNDWEVVMLNEWTGTQIIQFANRLRAKDLFINCFYSDKTHQYSHSADRMENQILQELKEISNIRTDGASDPVLHGRILKDKTWVIWDDKRQCYIFDEIHGKVYLDWIDYKDYHSTLTQIRDDLEKAGYEVVTINTDKPKEKVVKAKRNATLSDEDNQILAESLIVLLSHNPDFRDNSDFKLIDKQVLPQYATNIRPNILKLLRLFDTENDIFELPSDYAWQVVSGIIERFISEQNGKKHFHEYGFRQFSECHVMVSRIENNLYSDMFQKFYESVCQFVKSKEEFTQSEIKDFISTQVKTYLIDATEPGSRDKVEKALKIYFKIFTDKTEGTRKTVRYVTTKHYRLALRYTLNQSNSELIE